MMRTTRRTLVLLLTATALGLAGGYFILDYATTPEPGITLECYDRLRDGMTIAQVEAILGRPCDFEDTLIEPWLDGEADVKVSCRDWQSDDGELKVSVQFRPDGTAYTGIVVRRSHIPVPVPDIPRDGFTAPTSVLAAIRRLLHL
jgi:hypothetical protein